MCKTFTGAYGRNFPCVDDFTSIWQPSPWRSYFFIRPVYTLWIDCFLMGENVFVKRIQNFTYSIFLSLFTAWVYFVHRYIPLHSLAQGQVQTALLLAHSIYKKYLPIQKKIKYTNLTNIILLFLFIAWVYFLQEYIQRENRPNGIYSGTK